MQFSERILRGLAVTLVLMSAGLAAAENEQLAKAQELFAQQDYAAAQALLAKVERDKLEEADQAAYDRLKKELPLALAGSEKARQDMVAADQAYAAERWEEAEARYRAVLDNRYASAALKGEASQRLERIVEKRRLAEAAEPEGVVPVPAKAAEPAQPAAPETAPAAAPAPRPAPRRVTPIDEMRLRDELLWQRAVAQSEEAAAKAREAVERKEFTLARQYAEVALQKIEAARRYAEPAEKYVAAREAALRLKQEVADAFKAWQQEQAAREQQEIASRVEKRRQLQEQHRREKVEQLFNTASQLRKQQRFEEAAEVLRQILYIDPANAKARAQLDVAEDYASLHAQKQWQRDLDTQSRDAILSAQEALIPWDYEVLYPKNWLELTARRKQTGTEIGGGEGSSELPRKLEEILPEFEFEEAPLEAVMEHLHEVQDVNIAVDWEDLEQAGVSRDKPISLSLRNLPFKTVLEEVLAQVGGDVPLSYSVAEGLLRIATKDKLDRKKYVRVYDVRDLLMNVARFPNAARMDPAMQVVENSSGRPLRSHGGLFESPGNREEPSSSENVTSDELIQRLMSVIRQTVEPDSWQENGGSDASIRELNGQLIVYNTSAAHSQVRGLLDQLRARRALQIALEARFLDVTSNFLEEFGVDLDFVFNSATAGYDRAFSGGTPLVDPFTGSPVLIPRQFTQIGSLPGTPGWGIPLTAGAGVSQPFSQAGLVPYATGVGPHWSEMTPVTAQQNSLVLTDPGTLNTQVPGSFAERASFNPALNIAGSFLDNLQVDFLIRATQANGRSSIVQAPRIVMENWSQTFIQIGRSSQYISSINPTVAEGAALAQPVPQVAQSGSTLGVFGTVSADRRYVSVRVQATQADAPRFSRFEVTRASGNSPGVFVQLLDQGFVQINTQVSIPDGGTVLLGGLKQAGEIEVEAGVPILSKVPVLRRFFSNRSTVKDTRTLLVLMKAKIIIQSEAEEEAFPTFSSVGGGG